MQPSESVLPALPCKRCKKSASRKISAAAVTFAHAPDAPSPQNTGASAVDHDPDVVIGRAAERNLREYQARQDYKLRVIEANDTTGSHLSRLDDGEYFVMTDQEMGAARKARLMNQEAMHKIQAWKKRRRAASVEAAS